MFYDHINERSSLPFKFIHKQSHKKAPWQDRSLPPTHTYMKTQTTEGKKPGDGEFELELFQNTWLV